MVESIAQGYCFNSWEGSPSLEELDWPDRLAVACFLADFELRCKLEPKGAEFTEFLDDQALFPGEGISAAGKAVERIINAAMVDGLNNPTPKKLLEWLNGQRPISDSNPLTVKHPLWIDEAAGLDWKVFRNLVRSADGRAELPGNGTN